MWRKKQPQKQAEGTQFGAGKGGDRYERITCKDINSMDDILTRQLSLMETSTYLLNTHSGCWSGSILNNSHDIKYSINIFIFTWLLNSI